MGLSLFPFLFFNEAVDKPQPVDNFSFIAVKHRLGSAARPKIFFARDPFHPYPEKIRIFRDKGAAPAQTLTQKLGSGAPSWRI